MKTNSLQAAKSKIDDIKNCPGYPSEERLGKGKVAVIECIQDIPCNPCETVCPKSAIEIGSPITNLPRFRGDLCDGCGKCISICPGLAIFIVDNTYSDNEATISIPYEMLSMPEKDEIVEVLDRNGIKICEGKVIRVQNPKSFDRTAVITFMVLKKYSELARNIRRKG